MNTINTLPLRGFLIFLTPLIYFFFIASTATLYAQDSTRKQISFTNFSDIKGYPKQEIFGITTDKQGFFWVASADGLYKFDAANSIQAYKKEDSLLQSNTIRTIYADSQDNIWIGTTLGGLTKFHQPSETWKTYLSDTNDPYSISNNDILSILEDSQGRIWIGTEKGLNLYNQETDNFYTFLPDPSDPTSISAKAVVDILEDSSGRIWLSTWAGGINLLLNSNENISDSQFRHFYPSTNTEAGNVWTVYQDRKNRMWVGTIGGGIYLMELPSEATNKIGQQDWTPQFHSFTHDENDKTSISNNAIFDIQEDSQGYFWLASSRGLSRTKIPTTSTSKDYSNLKLEFEHFHANPASTNSIGSGNVYTIYEDKQQLLWFGSESGISQYSWQANQFQNYSIFDNTDSAPEIKDILSISETEIWISTDRKGLLKFNTESNKLEPVPTIGDDNLLDNVLTKLYSKDKEQIYVGTAKGIAIIDLKNLNTRSIPLPKTMSDQHPSFHVNCMLKDHRDQLWIGTHTGLFRLDETTGTYTFFSHDLTNPTSISDSHIQDLFEDSNGSLWVATFRGLNRTDINQPGKTFFKRYYYDINNPQNSLLTNQLTALEQVDNYLYIGSQRGLFRYNIDTDYFENLNQSHTRYRTASLEIGTDNKLWGSTKNSIFSYDTKKGTFHIFNSKDEIGRFMYRLQTSSKEKQDLFFASERGITKFNPTDLKTNKKIPPVVITSVKKLNTEGVFITNDINENAIQLEYDDYHLSINFSVQNYINSKKNQYAYQLEGFNENWTYTDEAMTAVYTNLSHGTYTFKVKGANNDGVWNESPTTLSIVKKPAYWETWWFKGFLFFTLLFFSALGMQYYTKNVRERNQELKVYTDNLSQEITVRKGVEKELHQREQYMEVLVKQRTEQLELKNVEVHALLKKLKNRNDELEETVANRTQELRAYNEELKRSNYDLEQFAYIASHDLQAPLRTIKSFSDLLVKSLDKKLNTREQDFIGFIIQSVENMQELVDSLLTFSRVNAKRGTIKSIQLSKLFQVIQAELATVIEEQNAIIQLSNLPEIVYADKVKFKQLLQNLITNGIKFSRKGIAPIVTIRCKDQVDFWRFEVEDNGIGIDEQFKEKIFQLFQRLHTKAEYQGTGIGLALCKKIVEQHGGQIWVESKEGEGSRFIFTINKFLNKDTVDNQVVDSLEHSLS